MVSISLKTKKSFIVHPWCLLSVVGLEEYSAHDWRGATSVQRTPVTWREWGLWSWVFPERAAAIMYMLTKHVFYGVDLLTVTKSTHTHWESEKHRVSTSRHFTRSKVHLQNTSGKLVCFRVDIFMRDIYQLASGNRKRVSLSQSFFAVWLSIL